MYNESASHLIAGGVSVQAGVELSSRQVSLYGNCIN
jgi:hypothetical protein